MEVSNDSEIASLESQVPGDDEKVDISRRKRHCQCHLTMVCLCGFMLILLTLITAASAFFIADKVVKPEILVFDSSYKSMIITNAILTDSSVLFDFQLRVTNPNDEYIEVTEMSPTIISANNHSLTIANVSFTAPDLTLEPDSNNQILGKGTLTSAFLQVATCQGTMLFELQYRARIKGHLIYTQQSMLPGEMNISIFC